jgi:hypothetical protein
MLKRMTADLPPLPTELPPAPHTGQAANDEPQFASAMRPIEVGPIVGLTLRSLRCGCYLVSYTPKAGLLTTFDGTIRVECHSNGRTASGDLYQRNVIFLPSGSATGAFSPSLPSRPMLAAAPNPGSGIPVFARNRYRYYLRVTQLLESLTFSSSFTLGFEMYRFTAPNTWVNEGAFKAVMNWKPAPAGFPSASDYLEGDVKNSGEHRGPPQYGLGL